MGPTTTPTVDEGHPVQTELLPSTPPNSTEAVTQSRPAPSDTAVPGRRAGHAWVALIPGMLALAVVLVFVFQNLQHTKVSFLVLSGNAPLGLALVAAALLGGLVVFGLGSVRILQLRKLARGRYRGRQEGS
jgi:lipopolysaccharide assembly protein A